MSTVKPVYGYNTTRLAAAIAAAAEAGSEPVPPGAKKVLDAAPHRLRYQDAIDNWDDVSDRELVAIANDRQVHSTLRARAAHEALERGTIVEPATIVELLDGRVGGLYVDDNHTRWPGHQHPARLIAYAETLSRGLDRDTIVELVVSGRSDPWRRYTSLRGRSVTAAQVNELNSDGNRYNELLAADVTVEGGWIANIEVFDPLHRVAAVCAGLISGETLDDDTARIVFGRLGNKGVTRRVKHRAVQLLDTLARRACVGDTIGTIGEYAAALFAAHDSVELRTLAACYGALDSDQLTQLVCELEQTSNIEHRTERAAVVATLSNTLEPDTLERARVLAGYDAHLSLGANHASDDELVELLTGLGDHGMWGDGLINWMCGRYEANPYSEELVPRLAHRGPWIYQHSCSPDKRWGARADDIGCEQLAALASAPEGKQFIYTLMQRHGDPLAQQALLYAYKDATAEELAAVFPPARDRP